MKNLLGFASIHSRSLAHAFTWTFTAFFLEASFFGIVDFEKRWPETLGKLVENRSTT